MVLLTVIICRQRFGDAALSSLVLMELIIANTILLQIRNAYLEHEAGESFHAQTNAQLGKCTITCMLFDQSQYRFYFQSNCKSVATLLCLSADWSFPFSLSLVCIPHFVGQLNLLVWMYSYLEWWIVIFKGLHVLFAECSNAGHNDTGFLLHWLRAVHPEMCITGCRNSPLWKRIGCELCC